MMNPLDVYRPESDRFPEAAGLYPYTFNATPANSGERLQTLANMAGFTIYAADFMGQETGEIFGLPAREALKPGNNFAKTCRQQAEFLADTVFASDYSVRIGIGDSLGVTSITGIHAHAQDIPTIFSALQLRDGFNLRLGQQRSALAYASFVGYQLADTLQARLPSKFEAVELSKLSDDSEIAERHGKPISVIDNMRNLGEIMQQDEGLRGTVYAATDTSLAVHTVGLKHGLSGRRSTVAKFFDTLHLVRSATAERELGSAPAELVTRIEKGWHSDILDPSLGAYHLNFTRQLVK